MSKNIEILKRKGMSEEKIGELEAMCLDTSQLLFSQIVSFSISEVQAEEIAKEINVNEKLKKRMHAISPLEGRYDRYVDGLHNIVSEFEWTKRRVMIETEYLIALTDELHDNYKGKKRKLTHRKFTTEEKEKLRSLYENFSEDDFRRIQLLDRHIQHDIVAMTTWMIYELGDSMGDLKESVETALHFPLTSNDINQNVYNIIVMDMLRECYLPAVIELQETLIDKVSAEKDVVFAGQTHGQYAEHTTLRKIFANWANAVNQTLDFFLVGVDKSGPITLPGKLGGAVGNNSDLLAAYPDHRWLNFHEEFIEDLPRKSEDRVAGLEYTKMCDQPEFGIQNQKLYDNMALTNDVLIKVCSDFWMYCNRGLFKKTTKPGESGSSVMAQKTNPWLSEGAETDFSRANQGFKGFESMLKYRMQGDLRRSKYMRAIGIPFAQTIIAMKRLKQEIDKYEPNYEAIEKEVNEHPEMSAAAVQTILKREGIPEAYDMIKDITMGKPIKVDDERNDYEILANTLVKQGKITQKIKKEIVSIVSNPEKNTGYAKEFAKEAISDAKYVCECLTEAYR